MRFSLSFHLMLVLFFTLSCSHLPGVSDDRRMSPEESRRAAERNQAREQLADASRLIKQGELVAAEEAVAPLVGDEVFGRQAAGLLAEIATLRARAAEILPEDASERLAMFDIESRMGIPKSYGSTIVLPRNGEPNRLPTSSMEELLERRVSMRLDNAPLKTILKTLSGIDGLNFIADQALTAEGDDGPALTIHIEDLPLKEVLDFIARNMGIAFHVGADVIWVAKAGVDVPGGRAPKLETRVFQLAHGIIPHFEATSGGDVNYVPSVADNELDRVLKAFLSDGPTGAHYELFPDRNLLVVRNKRENLRLVETLLEAFDREPSQVLIEARFITISQSDMERLGFSLSQLVVPEKGGVVGFGELASSPTIERTVSVVAGKETEIANRVDSNMADAYSRRRLEAAGSFPGTLTLSGVLGNTTYLAVLDALNQLRSSKTLSVPRITVANNRTARIHRGTKRYYFEEYDLSAINQGDTGTSTKLVPVGKPKEIALGYQLDVKVNVGNDGETVMLALRPKINDISGYEFFDDAKLPILDENTLETTVAVKSGETVVLGGMMTKSVISQERKIPYLGDIPLLGRLFYTRTDEESPHHLLIFVNAQIIDSSGSFITFDPAPSD